MPKKKNCNNRFEIKGNIYAFDSSTIDLCLSVFWWAHFRKIKAEIKLHTLFDIKTQIPVVMRITEVNDEDITNYGPFVCCIFDRAYVDYLRLYQITKPTTYFIVRAKSNFKFKKMYSNIPYKSAGVIYKQTGKIDGFCISKDYPEKIIKMKFFDTYKNVNFFDE